MNEFERIIERCNELGVNDIAEIKSILKECNDINSVDKHKLISCREIYLAIALRNNADENYIFHEGGFIIEQIESIIREKEDLEHKDLSDSHYKKGLIMKWLNKRRESIACFTDALKYIDEYNTDSQTIIKPTHGKNELNCHIYFERGGIFLQSGEYNLAIKDYDEVIKINPNYTRVYKSLGMSYTFIGSFDKAKEYFDKYVPEPDTSVNPINIHAMCYSVNNVPDFVIESIKKVNYWISDSVYCEHEITKDGTLCFGTIISKP